MKTKFKLVVLSDVTNHPIVQKKLVRANELLSKSDLSPIYERRKQREEAKKGLGI
ncbi:hypothetical protein [Dyadobacter psychrophilus]|uniref:Uncharacterized protein n=1 Tax=Dyadobacter psychrophilus TaxID=651661 RepID=A0A1T5C876_9BACT|nr:hypothetical protein [Dyadobacter psychrophilus]SKB55625.1 hypothetical protein SAMN05660293_00987 [Dyadobacter psychrophilus]